MKYKVGDKVRIKKDLTICKTEKGSYNCYVTPAMRELEGKICTIDAISESLGYYKLRESTAAFAADMFEPVELEMPNGVTFKFEEEKKRKFSIGDKVILKPEIKENDFIDRLTITKTMYRLHYTPKTIVAIDNQSDCLIKIGGIPYWYPMDSLMLYEEKESSKTQTEEKFKITKSNIKSTFKTFN